MKKKFVVLLIVSVMISGCSLFDKKYSIAETNQGLLYSFSANLEKVGFKPLKQGNVTHFRVIESVSYYDSLIMLSINELPETGVKEEVSFDFERHGSKSVKSINYMSRDLDSDLAHANTINEMYALVSVVDPKISRDQFGLMMLVLKESVRYTDEKKDSIHGELEKEINGRYYRFSYANITNYPKFMMQIYDIKDDTRKKKK